MSLFGNRELHAEESAEKRNALESGIYSAHYHAFCHNAPYSLDWISHSCAEWIKKRLDCIFCKVFILGALQQG